MEYLKNITLTLNLYQLRKSVNNDCKLDFNEYIRLKNQYKEYSLNHDKDNNLYDGVAKYHDNIECIKKYDMIQFYEKILQHKK